MHGIQTLPENVEQVGFYNRRPVLRETIRRPIKDVVRDKDGNIVYHLDSKGNPIRSHPHTQIVRYEEIVREYQEVPLLDSKGNWTGITQKNFHFREDPEVTAAREVETAAQQDLKDAAVLARKHGRSLKDMFAQLLGDEEVEDEAYPRKLPGVGRWELSSGTPFKGTREAAEAAEVALQVPA